MSLYDDIQSDVAEAFDTDLADAVTTFTFTEFGTPAYDASTGTTVTPETDYEIRGVVIKNIEGEIADESVFKDLVKLLILASEATVTFIMDMKVAFGGDSYKIVGISKDPANATFTLDCRRY